MTCSTRPATNLQLTVPSKSIQSRTVRYSGYYTKRDHPRKKLKIKLGKRWLNHLLQAYPTAVKSHQSKYFRYNKFIPSSLFGSVVNAACRCHHGILTRSRGFTRIFFFFFPLCKWIVTRGRSRNVSENSLDVCRSELTNWMNRKSKRGKKKRASHWKLISFFPQIPLQSGLQT